MFTKLFHFVCLHVGLKNQESTPLVIASQSDIASIKPSPLENVNILNYHRNLTRDKIKGFNRLDSFDESIATVGYGEANKSVHRSISNTGLVRNDYSFSVNNPPLNNNSNNFLEMKLMAKNGSNVSKNIMFNEPQLASRTRPESDPNLDPVDGIVSLLSAIYCQILVFIGSVSLFVELM